MINREDMLELTRRMTSARSHLSRLAGAYMDEEGYVDGTFNSSFLNLKGSERSRMLEIAKTIPFSKTNEELISYRIPGMKPDSIWRLLYALRECELKNDALMLTLYEMIGEQYQTGSPYAIYVFYGAYDVPVKASDKYRFDESEELYRYLLVAICPLDHEQEPELPAHGFLYPAFTQRSTDMEHVNMYTKAGENPEHISFLI